MKNPLIAALFAGLSCMPLGGQVVYSHPAGFVKLGNTTPGQDAVPANTDVNLSVPLERDVEFNGTVASTTATAITVQGTPGWTSSPDQWVPASGAPYCAIIASGTENGLRGLITANTADTLTIDITTPGDLTAVSAGDAVEIRKCWTLSSIFAGSTLSTNCQVLLFDETNSGINHSSSQNYLYFAGDWYDATTFLVDNDVVIHPGERFIFRSADSVPSLTLFGDVPSSSSRIDLTKDGTGEEDMEISHASPVPVVVGDLSIPAENNDQILVFNNESTGINKSSSNNLLFYEGLWYDATTFLDVSTTFVLAPGQGFVLRKSATSSNGVVEWSEPAPYQP